MGRLLLRWAFSLTALLSAILCVATAGAWAFTRYYDCTFGVSRYSLGAYAWSTSADYTDATQSWLVAGVESGRVGLVGGSESHARVRKSALGWKTFSFPGHRWDYGIRLGQRYGSDGRRDEVLGCAFYRYRRSNFLKESGWETQVPCSFLVLLLALPPAVWVGRKRAAARSRRSNPNPCPRCGYNLTGNVSGRCPECGAAVTAPTAATVQG